MNESELGDDQGQCIDRPTAPTTASTSPDNSVNNDKKKKRRNRGGSSDEEFVLPDCGVSPTGREEVTGGLIEGLNLSDFGCSMASPMTEPREFWVFVATWNVGGKAPNLDMNLEDFFLTEDSADIYICGFQEIVPLNAGNVLVIEDNEPAAKWLVLTNQVLNKLEFDFT
ncbi:type I inositol polyphosphate 5-phosphatase 5-like [Hibiscus syriacus]|uniref:type I inositol polyphosphate 5-phosphatase 5-like n=1 Tax=Hibiscus syriacus TaxID=106335 RepID=UPI0019237927|nr:type I inositol polyphosphate 5-phosphatase 5-like [Hibiscus syriacus]